MHILRSLLVTIFLVCAGCGSASMRIDIEVYKGPLSKQPMIQLADLLGFLDEVRRGVTDNNHVVTTVALNKDFPKTDIGKYPPERWCDRLDPVGPLDQIDYFDCIVLRSLRIHNDNLLEQLKEYEFQIDNALSYSDTSLGKLLLDLSRLAGQMRKSPFSYAISGTAGHTVNFKVRIAKVVCLVTTAEYGNQLHARIDALMKQWNDGGYDRKELPLSVYIGDTEPTDFVHLFDQWDAATDRSWAWWMVAAVDGSVKERINMVKRLFADHHWSKVNTAYASGWGKTQMAFIKDDIGNWNLKSFDNSPEELLKAYTKVGTTTLARAATLAADIHSGGAASAVGSLVKLSRNVSLPGSGEKATGPSIQLIAELHNRAEIKLRETAWAAIAEDASKSGKPEEQKEVRRKLIDSLELLLQDHDELIELTSVPH